MTNKVVYGLVAESNPEFIFYVGCTDNPHRRFNQHYTAAHSPNHPEYNTNKYKFIRELDVLNCHWRMDILSSSFQVDEKHDEYSWILRAARENIENGNVFFDDQPLTNMKAGDFLEEMLADKNFQSITPHTVKDYIEKRKREISYERERVEHRNPMIDEIQSEAEVSRKKHLEKTANKIERLEKRLQDELKIQPPREGTIRELERELRQLRSYINLFEE